MNMKLFHMGITLSTAGITSHIALKIQVIELFHQKITLPPARMQISVSYNNDSSNGYEINPIQSETQNPYRNEESSDLANQYETKRPKNMLPNNIFNRNNERSKNKESHTGSTISPPMECSGRNTDIHYASVALFVQSGRLIHHTHNGHHYGSLLFSVPVDQL